MASSSSNLSSAFDAAEGHVGTRRSLRRVVVSGAARGLVSGLAATLAMSAVMLGAQKLGMFGRLPPRKITNAVLGAFGLHRKTSESTQRALATINHFAFGGACGALFGLAHEVRRVRAPSSHGARGHRAPPIAAGLAFGTTLWAVSYAGWVPAFGIMPPPHVDRPGRQPVMIAAHWVYGAVLAKVLAASVA